MMVIDMFLFKSIKAVRTENRQKSSKPDNNNKNSCPVNADHIPPKNSLKKAYEMLQQPENLEQAERLQREQPKLYQMLTENGNLGLCREVLTEHHKQILTTGSSKESKQIR